MDHINLIDSLIVAYVIVALGNLNPFSKIGNIISDGCFLAGRRLSWVMVGAALFASNISTINWVGLASSGYKVRLVGVDFEWMSSIALITLWDDNCQFLFQKYSINIF